MTLRPIPIIAVVSALLELCAANQCSCAPPAQDSLQNFRQTLQLVASDSPDPCTSGVYVEGPKAQVESTLFGLAVDMVTAELNATSAGTKTPAERATEALKKLERMSAEVNAAWPAESRFHFQVLDIWPAIVIKVSFRIRARFFVFGVPEDHKWNPKRLWRQVGLDEESLAPKCIGCRFVIDLYPLHRGPSGNARFLAKFSYIPCTGIAYEFSYDAYEWKPKDYSGDLEQIIRQEGAFGLFDEPPGQVSTMKGAFFSSNSPGTEGSILTLPYCWRSPIDTADHPDLCAVDTYDLSGDDIRFRSRVYNQPDLLPIARAIEYAEKRDFRAILGYCSSKDIADRMVRDLPQSVYAGDLQVTGKGEGKEHVDLEYSPNTYYHFDIEKRDGHWLIVAFSE